MTMNIPSGATAYIGPPAKPMPKEISDAIGKALGAVSEIEEAHLPMVYIKGHIDPSAQILVVVVDEKIPSPQAKISEAIKATLPTNSYLDIMVLKPVDKMLPTIRATGTQLNLDR